MRVHAAVPEVVWWPANIMEMNIPVTCRWRIAVHRPPRRIDMRTSRRSRSSSVAGGPVVRRSMMPWTRSTSPRRAASRRRKVSMSA